MFALRETAVSLTFFVLIYCSLSAIVALAWQRLRFLRTSDRSLANLLFGVRVFPSAASVIFTFAFVVPSFQILEPRSVEEGVGTKTLGLGICALLLIAIGCIRVVSAHTKASRVIARWMEGAVPAGSIRDTYARIFRARAAAPPLTLVGVRTPLVLVSESAISLLSEDELRIALKHEVEHIRSRDNLKKLIFRCCPFPGLANLESAWSESAELAADDAAVSRLPEAVDLAAALIKLSRMVTVEPPPVCTIGFVTGGISTRVARLLAWDGAAPSRPTHIRGAYLAPAFLALFGWLYVTYSPALVLTHQVTEWLVR